MKVVKIGINNSFCFGLLFLYGIFVKRRGKKKMYGKRKRVGRIDWWKRRGNNGY